MEFLFLNESATEDTFQDEMKAFVEETYGVKFEGLENKNFSDVMLEAEEALHESEITAMKEEFALYQESLSLNESDDEKQGWIAKGVDTLKKWWKKLCEWVAKIWFAILNFIDKVVNWIRKGVLTVISAFKGTKKFMVPQGIWNAIEKFDIGEVRKAAQAAEATFNNDVMKAASVEDAKKKFDQVTEQMDKAVSKSKEDLVAAADKVAGRGDDKNGKIEVQLSDLKKRLDDCVRMADTMRQAGRKLQQMFARKMKETEAKMKDAGNEKEEIRKVGSILKLGAKSASKVYSRGIGTVKFLASKLFSLASAGGKKAATSENQLKKDAKEMGLQGQLSNMERRKD